MSAALYGLTDHICASCQGRILRVIGPGHYRCSNCGVEAATAGPGKGSLCACRIRFGSRDAGIRCVKNDNQRPEMPGEIIAKEIK